jgi:hypothetical protein
MKPEARETQRSEPLTWCSGMVPRSSVFQVAPTHPRAIARSWISAPREGATSELSQKCRNVDVRPSERCRRPRGIRYEVRNVAARTKGLDPQPSDP